MAYTKEYSPADSVVTFDDITLTGLSPDSAISVTYNEDLTDEEVGMLGEVAKTINPDQTVKIQLTFQQDGFGHRALLDLIANQKLKKTLLVAPLRVNINTGEKIVVPAAHVKTMSERGWGKTASGSNRAWTLFGEKVNELESIDPATLSNVFNI